MDFLWFYGKSTNLRSTVKWNGFIVAYFNLISSGFKEALCTIYAQILTDKVLTGRVLSRVVRGQILVQAAKADLIISYLNLNKTEVEFLKHLLNTPKLRLDSCVKKI